MKMKILKYFGFFFLSLLLIILIGSFFIAKRTLVERKINIGASPKEYFELINDLEKWPLWMPWYKMDTSMQITYGPNTKGTAAYYTWKSKNKKVGNGKISIASSQPYEQIKINLEFGENGISNGWFKFKPTNNGSELKWGIEIVQGELPIIGKWIGLLMEKMIGIDFENALAKIKKLAETGPVKAKGMVENVSVINVDEFTMLQCGKISDKDSVSKSLGTLYGIIGSCAKEKNIKIGFPLMAMYPNYAIDKDSFIVTACVKIDKPVISCNNEIKCSTINSCKALVANYYGPYDGINIAYDQIGNFAKKNNIVLDSSTAWEAYISDPIIEKDQSKILTKVYYKIK
jgi:effector-binding domain-containing protein